MYTEILAHLPYKSTFRFVDEISFLSMDEVVGNYTPKKDAFFYKDHFEGQPVTPGAILSEIMAQIGLVVLGIYLILHASKELNERVFPLLTSSDVSFYKMVLPEQKLTVSSKKQYFRFGKLKCFVEMRNDENELIAKGMFSGIIKKI